MNSAKALLLALLFLTAACTPVIFPDPEEPPFFATVETILATRTAEVEAGVSTPVPTLAPGCMAEIVDGEFLGIICEVTAEPAPQRTNWLLLGGDNRAHREDTGWGNKTDVIVLVSVLESDPVEISVVQFPRNLYVPTSIGDLWLFSVWDEAGWQGLHQYFQEAFGVSLQGIFYVDMDGFVQIVDEMGEIRVRDSGGTYQLGGEDALDYLRDNENNWGTGSYDAEERVFAVISGLYFEFERIFTMNDPLSAVDTVFLGWGDLIKTDLANIKQWYWFAHTYIRIDGRQWNFNWVQLEEPYIVRGETPIMQNELPMRGMIADTDLKIWMEEVFNERR